MTDLKPQDTTLFSIEERLYYRQNHDDEGCRAALNGERVPFALGNAILRICTLRGIRYHHGFAQELKFKSGFLEFTRNLNARDIMSDILPEIEEDDHFPYCIWYPDLAKEDTYRQLATKYPRMRYSVGRACAVAGYVELWRELDLLPDVSIAEEARDNIWMSTGSKIIFDDIMSKGVLYNVMNDYDRSVNDTPLTGRLNSDTCVRSELRKVHSYPSSDDRFTQCHLDNYDEDLVLDQEKSPYIVPLNVEVHWDITEDLCISDHGYREAKEEVLKRRLKYSMRRPEPEHRPEPEVDARVTLLYSPLPQDLPNINKDVLILQAAHSGNIDRYARLRRPHSICEELDFVIDGIFHHTMFAKWWSMEIAKAPRCVSMRIRQAIHARFIMNNDLTHITELTPHEDLPEQIHYPELALASTYAELARRKPQMTAAIAMACILADYEKVYRNLDMEPADDLVIGDYISAACASFNPFYLKDLMSRDEYLAKDDDLRDWDPKTVCRDPDNLNRTSFVYTKLEDGWTDLDRGNHVSRHGGRCSRLGALNLFVSVSKMDGTQKLHRSPQDLDKGYGDAGIGFVPVDRPKVGYSRTRLDYGVEQQV